MTPASPNDLHLDLGDAGVDRGALLWQQARQGAGVHSKAATYSSLPRIRTGFRRPDDRRRAGRGAVPVGGWCSAAAQGVVLAAGAALSVSACRACSAHAAEPAHDETFGGEAVLADLSCTSASPACRRHGSSSPRKIAVADVGQGTETPPRGATRWAALGARRVLAVFHARRLARREVGDLVAVSGTCEPRGAARDCRSDQHVNNRFVLQSALQDHQNTPRC